MQRRQLGSGFEIAPLGHTNVNWPEAFFSPRFAERFRIHTLLDPSAQESDYWVNVGRTVRESAQDVQLLRNIIATREMERYFQSGTSVEELKKFEKAEAEAASQKLFKPDPEQAKRDAEVKRSEVLSKFEAALERERLELLRLKEVDKVRQQRFDRGGARERWEVRQTPSTGDSETSPGDGESEFYKQYGGKDKVYDDSLLENFEYQETMSLMMRRYSKKGSDFLARIKIPAFIGLVLAAAIFFSLYKDGPEVRVEKTKAIELRRKILSTNPTDLLKQQCVESDNGARITEGIGQDLLYADRPFRADM